MIIDSNFILLLTDFGASNGMYGYNYGAFML
jgi:hypothetical protein